MKKKQNLYLVFGGNLKKIGKDDFSNVKSLEYVGIYESLKDAKKILEVTINKKYRFCK